MYDSEAISILVRLICSFGAAFPAVAILRKTRNGAWVLMILSAVFFFIDALYSTLVMIGIASYKLTFLGDVPVLQLLLTGIPYLFMACGFAFFLISHRRY